MIITTTNKYNNPFHSLLFIVMIDSFFLFLSPLLLFFGGVVCFSCIILFLLISITIIGIVIIGVGAVVLQLIKLKIDVVD